MNKHIRKDSGFGFFLTFLILALGIVISTTLLMTVMTDSKATSKNLGQTQAKDLAVKGVESAAYSLNDDILNHSTLKTKFKNGVSHKEYTETLEKLFSQKACIEPNLEKKLLDEFLTTKNHKPFERENYNHTVSETGDVFTCIDGDVELYDYGIKDFNKDPQGFKNALYKVTFKSIGISKTNEIESTYKTMLIGSEGFPEALRFALSTYSNGNQPTDGNMYLNGSTDIQGDLKVSNNLIVTDAGPTGYRNSGNLSWTDTPDSKKYYNFAKTGLPYLNPAENNTVSRVIVENNIYKRTITDNYSEYVSNYFLNTGKPTTLELRNNLFRSKSPIIQVNREATRNTVDIQHQLNLAKERYPIMSKVATGYKTNNINFYKNDSKAHKDSQISFTDNSKYSFEDTKIFVNGDLNLGGGRNRLTIEGDRNSGEGVTFYVNGNVNIENVDLTANMLIYASGNVTVTESTIKGIDLTQIENASPDIKKLKEGTLIIFSKGSIHFSNNSLYLKNPSSIKVFFLSEKNIEIFGVGSNLYINGGISANRLILNTLNATYSSGKQSSRKIYPNDQSKSRLKIYYDPYLVEAYLKLYPPEPVFYGPDVPIEYEIAS